MKKLKVDLKNNFLELVPETLDDLWYLERILEKGDLVSGSSERKIKGEEGRKAEKIVIWVEVQAEKIEFHESFMKLRVSGPMKSMKPEEFFEANAFHSIEFGLKDKIRIKKKKIKEFQLEIIDKAVKSSVRSSLLLVVLDDEEAIIAEASEKGIKTKTTIKSGKQGKRFKEEKQKENKFFEELLKKIQAEKKEKVLIAGPGFTKNDFKKFLENKKVNFNPVFENTNSIGKTGLNELLKTGLIEKVLKESRLIEENKKMDELMKEARKENSLVEYGLNEIEKAVEKGAVQELIVSDKKFFEEREKIQELMEKAESFQGKVFLFSSEHEAGEYLNGFGGIIALLRFRN
ncbi:mRNA surveillance protein pelota [Candidatus Micrarchaeota archaeon]|nr:mRNA surveillance protein pelota [Candidatus Micrarchaeota archaeon]MBU2477395.1 mRNA surveillance protein pelota [Candidatus Micrarchaeota archaeon]